MPSGQTHLKVSLVSSVFIVPLLFSAVGAQSVSSAIAIGAGCVAGCLITPDMDVDSGNYSYFVIRRFLGSVGEWLFALYWQPYALAIRHRSIVSHGLLIGTAVKFVYLFFPILIFIVNQGKRPGLSIFIRSIPAQLLAFPLVIFVFLLVYYGTMNIPILVLFFVTWSALDALHILADFIF